MMILGVVLGRWLQEGPFCIDVNELQETRG